MKLGLMTAASPGQSLEQVASWAWGDGFEMLEIACCPVGKDLTGVLSQPTAPRTGPSRAGDRAPEESDPDR
jgi:hypothetical protein